MLSIGRRRSESNTDHVANAYGYCESDSNGCDDDSDTHCDGNGNAATYSDSEARSYTATAPDAHA